MAYQNGVILRIPPLPSGGAPVETLEDSEFTVLVSNGPAHQDSQQLSPSPAKT
jgi:hypothetical protein